MKTIILALFALALGAQTRTNLSDIKPPAAPAAPVYLFGMFPGVGLVALDPAAFVIDKTTNPPTLRAIAVQPAGSAEFDDLFVALASQTVYISTSAPRSIVRVYKNGLLQRASLDYSLTTDPVSKIATATFLPAQPIGAGDLVTLSYQR